LRFLHRFVKMDLNLSSMRKSRTVPLTLLTATALATTTGCDNRPRVIRNCVDAQNQIVTDDRCDHPAFYPGGGVAYHYLYGGRSGGRMGDTVEGGSSEPEAGARVVSGETGVERGGFGHAGEGGHGGGE
jgi:hypothetical protein